MTAAPSPHPTTAQIHEARQRAGLTQSAAGALVHSSERAWRKWEKGERKMHRAIWELFVMKVQTGAR